MAQERQWVALCEEDLASLTANFYKEFYEKYLTAGFLRLSNILESWEDWRVSLAES
jgi:hypothetical protein